MAYYEPGTKRWANSTYRDIRSLTLRALEFSNRANDLYMSGDRIAADDWKRRADTINAEVARDVDSLRKFGFAPPTDRGQNG